MEKQGAAILTPDEAKKLISDSAAAIVTPGPLNFDIKLALEIMHKEVLNIDADTLGHVLGMISDCIYKMILPKVGAYMEAIDTIVADNPVKDMAAYADSSFRELELITLGLAKIFRFNLTATMDEATTKAVSFMLSTINPDIVTKKILEEILPGSFDSSTAYGKNYNFGNLHTYTARIDDDKITATGTITLYLKQITPEAFREHITVRTTPELLRGDIPFLHPAIGKLMGDD